MVEITIPRLAGTRDGARNLLDATQSDQMMLASSVVVVCREVVSLSPSFADELVHQVFEVRGAADLVLLSPPNQVSDRITAAAVRRGVADRVRIAAAATGLA